MDSIDKLVMALGPVFAAGLAVQQLLEILDPIIDKVVSNHKKVFIGVVSLIAGLVVAFNADLHVLQVLGALAEGEHERLDAALTGIIISGGTEGINSILKFLKYKKEETKGAAAAKVSATSSAVAAEPVLVPTPVALTAINRK